MSDIAATEGRVTEQMGQYAAQMKPWVRLMSVVFFVCAALMIVAGAFFAALGSIAGAAAQDATGARFGAVGGAVVGIFYALLGLLYFPPALFLHRSASAANRMKAGDLTSPLEDLLKSQKSFWRYVGVLTVIGLCVTVLALIAGVGAALLVPALSRQS